MHFTNTRCELPFVASVTLMPLSHATINWSTTISPYAVHDFGLAKTCLPSYMRISHKNTIVQTHQCQVSVGHNLQKHHVGALGSLCSRKTFNPQHAQVQRAKTTNNITYYIETKHDGLVLAKWLDPIDTPRHGEMTLVGRHFPTFIDLLEPTESVPDILQRAL